MTEPEAIIFDCDGVLFESHRANLAYYNRIFSAFDYPLIEDPASAEAHICHTASSPVVLEKLMKLSDVDAAFKFAQEIDYREFIPLMTPASGLNPGLKRLALKFPLAVATNRGGSMQEVLNHFALGSYFDSVVTSRDVERPKPAPDMLLLAAKNLGVKVSGCLFVGDSELDQRAAAGAEMPFVAFGEGLGGRQVNSHTELAALILDREEHSGFSGVF